MELTIIQFLILGIVQGITEWLPISSSGMLSLILANFYGVTNPGVLVTTSLFFHLGTFFAALIYLRKEVYRMFHSLFHYKTSKIEDKKVLNFIIFTTIISGVLGFLIIKLLFSLDFLDLTGKTISFAIGIMLLFTGIIQISKKSPGLKKAKDLKHKDSWVLGLAQAASVIPGISRSGITISALLLKKFDDTSALKLSFLMSLPIVLIGNIILNLEDLIFTPNALFGLLASFIFGLLTISFLMKLSKKINFAWFVIVFAILMMASILV